MSSSTPEFNFINFIRIIKKWRKQLLIVFLVAAVVSFVFTRPFLMPDYFESTAVVYPSNLTPYSLESPTETMLQYLLSEEVTDSLISQYNLYQHYKLNSKSPTHRKEIYEYLHANIHIARTAYESVEITVADQSPDTAALLVNGIIANMNLLARKLHNEKMWEVVVFYKNQLIAKKAELDSMEKILQLNADSFGVIEYESQAKELTRAYYGNNGSGAKVEKAYNDLKNKGLESFSISEHLWRMRGYYQEVKSKYEDAVRDFEKKITYANLVSPALPAEAKSFPHRTVIMILFSLSVLFFAMLVIFWIENYRKLIEPQIKAN